MLDPLLGLGAIAIALLTFPAAPALDPGPSSECPRDMRLVRGVHHDEVQHLCVDARSGAREGKDTHCFEYWEGITAEEGEATEISVCMDQFEAPNKRGERPYVMKSFNMAERWCGERGKRVCTEQEWELACEGPELRPFAYGWKVNRAICNSDKGWRPFDVKKLSAGGEETKAELERLWQGSPSGSHLACVSSYGIFDMMGNVEEWVATRSGPEGEEPGGAGRSSRRRRWPGALMGGFWAKPWTGCRGTNDAHEPTFVFYETGFRCCADPGTLDAEGRRIRPPGSRPSAPGSPKGSE